MAPSKFFMNNYFALKPFLRPNVVELIQYFSPSTTHITGNIDDKTLNLQTSDGPLYSPDAITYSQQHIEQYLSRPFRIQFSDFMHKQNKYSRILEMNIDVSQYISFQLANTSNSFIESKPPKFEVTSHLVCLGLGLGYYLPDLCENSDAKEILIIEPNFEFFYQSMHCFDWATFINKAFIKGINIKFYFEEDYVLLYSILEDTLKDQYFGLIEGSQIYQHYSHPVFTKILNRFRSSKANLLNYNGWIEDEVTHIQNHLENFSQYQFQFLDDAPARHMSIDKPALIIGSGPSLDDSMELIKINRHKFTLYSSGTSLEPLLINGIYPDFHCELENVPAVQTILTRLNQIYCLDDITLIASSTITPGAADCFKKKIFFLREGTALMSAICPNMTQMKNVAPSATNTSVKAAIAIGHKDIFLFGLDFGSRHPEKNYVEGVIYGKKHTHGHKKGQFLIASGGSSSGDLKFQIPGNFSSPIQSNDLLVYMRNRLETGLLQQPANIYNCSDGAKIHGTIPFTKDKFIEYCQTLPKDISFDFSKSLPLHNPMSLIDLDVVREIINTFIKVMNDFEKQLSQFKDRTQYISIEKIYGIFQLPFISHDTSIETNSHSAVREALRGSLTRIFHQIRYSLARTHVHKVEAQQAIINSLLAQIPLIKAASIDAISSYYMGMTNLDKRDEKRLSATAFLELMNAPEQKENIIKELKSYDLSADGTSREIFHWGLFTILDHPSLQDQIDDDLFNTIFDRVEEMEYPISLCQDLLIKSLVTPNIHLLRDKNNCIKNRISIQAIDKQPNALTNLAIFSYHTGDKEYATHVITKAREQYPDHLAILGWHIILTILIDGPIKGLSILKNVNFDTLFPLCQTIIGLAYYRLNNTQRAKDIWMQPKAYNLFQTDGFFLKFTNLHQNDEHKMDILNLCDEHKIWEARNMHYFNETQLKDA
ncbi:motility associated factor glycosyltransferase family protein [Curvivirga aplysinae]|uniref:motility associated factor glycosyltransferase family protein n=1 Tax=Curvivirga aplysinae TaxID=2529852 RepID=UPI0012BBD582|nr:6-hydroxymethylpterin diphosphokinase MptE-like protein [Curvivirga aplysinae]MTI08271.1 DUF115 domain-containing protein [Curvivirga aplysinae]